MCTLALSLAHSDSISLAPSRAMRYAVHLPSHARPVERLCDEPNETLGILHVAESEHGVDTTEQHCLQQGQKRLLSRRSSRGRLKAEIGFLDGCTTNGNDRRGPRRRRKDVGHVHADEQASVGRRGGWKETRNGKRGDRRVQRQV